MFHIPKAVIPTVLGLTIVAAAVSLTIGQDDKPFGGKKDVEFAKALWEELTRAKLVGADRIQVRPFEGHEPHGSIQQVLATTGKVEGRTGRLLVKVNHGGEGATVASVYDNPNKYIGAYTVMFKREAGYDSENKDWFWAKYKPDGSIDKNPKGMLLAGRVAKGMAAGCIACHKGLGGEDMETLTTK